MGYKLAKIVHKIKDQIMSRQIFGTDGVRGKANQPPMTAETLLNLAMATGHHFTRGDHRHIVVIGKDTRLSGYMVEPALTAGFISVGMDVVLVGPLPTPAIALLTRSLRADLGVVISASHNPFEDNGIKFFGPQGYKLSDETEREIETTMQGDLQKLLADSTHLGKARRLTDAAGRYIEFAKSTFPKHVTLEGLRVVIDCANGAAYNVAPTILWELGAEVITIANKPDGVNINEGCGATAPEKMQQAVIDNKAHIGLALDGDADRIVMADETGKLVDGDQIMALIATNWSKSSALKGRGVVGTVMSNLGLQHYLDNLGLKLERTQVGDRYVCEFMQKNGYNIGGEQSGHIILNDYTTTGDGLVAALQVLAVLAESKKNASDILHVFDPVPQLLRNVRYNGHNPLEADSVMREIKSQEEKLGNKGRILVRKSGTEPLLRVMAEGSDSKVIEECVDAIVNSITAAGAK